LTDAGISYLAQAFQKNRQTRSAHDTLVDLVAQNMLRDGRVIWTNLKLRARLPTALDVSARWKICMPDVFSIRNTSVATYLEPVVHEIKVSRADLLGDLKSKDKRDGYVTSLLVDRRISWRSATFRLCLLSQYFGTTAQI